MPWNLNILSVRAEGKSMDLTITIKVPDRNLITWLFNMHGFWFFEGERKSLFVFQPKKFRNWAAFEGIFIILTIEVQYLLNQHSSFED